MVDEDVQFRHRPHPGGWAHRRSLRHGHQGVSTTLPIGASQIGDGDVAVAETCDGFGPVGFELGLAVMGPHLAELGATQIIEPGDSSQPPVSGSLIVADRLSRRRSAVSAAPSVSTSACQRNARRLNSSYDKLIASTNNSGSRSTITTEPTTASRQVVAART